MSQKVQILLKEMNEIFQSLGQSLIILDANCNILSVNRATLNLLEIKEADIIGKKCSELFHNLCEKHPLCPLEKMFETASLQSSEIEIEALNGHFLISVSPIFNEKGEISKIIHLITDVSERHKMESELRASEDRLRHLYNNTTIGFYRTTPEGEIAFANPALVEMLGYSSLEDLRRRNLEAEGFELSYARAEFKDLLEERDQVRGLESAWKRRDGSVLYVRESARAFRNTEGKVIFYEGTVEDITALKEAEMERKKLEAQVQQLEKLESLSIMAGGIAHDFNNMLTGILGNASLALMEVEKDTTVFESLKAIEGIAFRASDLTYKMLSFSGKSRFHIQPLDLNRTIENLVQIFKSTISEEIIIKIDTIPDLPEIQADVGQIRHLVMSLLANATEAIGNLNGIVKINTGLLELDREFLSRTVVDDNLPEGDYIYIEVMDNGCGIEEERLSKIFDPFYSTKFTGRGLGLSSVLGIVRGHKGAIKVESQLGLGSTFTVFLPYLDKKKAGI